MSDQVPSLVELAGFGKTVRQVQELASLLGKLEMLRSESSFKTTNELLLALDDAGRATYGETRD